MKRLLNLTLITVLLAHTQVFPADQHDPQPINDAQELINNVGGMSFGNISIGNVLQNLINSVQHLMQHNAQLAEQSKEQATENAALKNINTQQLQQIAALQNTINQAKATSQTAITPAQHAQPTTAATIQPQEQAPIVTNAPLAPEATEFAHEQIQTIEQAPTTTTTSSSSSSSPQVISSAEGSSTTSSSSNAPKRLPKLPEGLGKKRARNNETNASNKCQRAQTNYTSSQVVATQSSLDLAQPAPVEDDTLPAEDGIRQIDNQQASSSLASSLSASSTSSSSSLIQTIQTPKELMRHATELRIENKLDESKEVCLQVLKMDNIPQEIRAKAHYELGHFYRKIDRNLCGRAQYHYSKVIEIDEAPDYARAASLLFLGDFSSTGIDGIEQNSLKAFHYYNNAYYILERLEQDSDYQAFAQKGLNKIKRFFLQLLTTYRSKQNDLQPANHRMHEIFNEGLRHLDAQRYDEATKLFAITNSNQSPYAIKIASLQNLFIIYDQMGNTAEAQEYYAQLYQIVLDAANHEMNSHIEEENARDGDNNIGRSSRHLYVANINYATTEAELKKLFERYGTVKSIVLLRDQQTGKPYGKAYIKMKDGNQAHQAIQNLNNTQFKGRELYVQERSFIKSANK